MTICIINMFISFSSFAKISLSNIIWTHAAYCHIKSSANGFIHKEIVIPEYARWKHMFPSLFVGAKMPVVNPNWPQRNANFSLYISKESISYFHCTVSIWIISYRISVTTYCPKCEHPLSIVLTGKKERNIRFALTMLAFYRNSNCRLCCLRLNVLFSFCSTRFVFIYLSHSYCNSSWSFIYFVSHFDSA